MRTSWAIPILASIPLIQSFSLPPLRKRISNEARSRNIPQTHIPPLSSTGGAIAYEESSSSPKEEWKKLQSKLRVEFFTIALPALIQLAAEPLASIVDTAYLGRLGPEVLGGAGVAISAQYAVSKLYNDPLLRTSISLVASQDGKARGQSKGREIQSDQQASKDLSVAVSSALLLAFSV